MTRRNKRAADKASKTPAIFEVRITESHRNAAGSGTWATGTVGDDYRFQALVFEGHAEVPEYEVNGTSRISKLWIQRVADKREVFNWDRGADRPAENAQLQAVVDQLCSELAERVFSPKPVPVPVPSDPNVLIERIAHEHLFINTLETRNSDRLDFHEVSVAGLKKALAAAYAAGQQASRKRSFKPKA